MKATHMLRAYIPGAGEEGKPRYVTIGALFTRPNGSPVVKLDSIPTDGRWQGWVNAYPWEEKDKLPAKKAAKSSISDDDIPF